MYSGIQGMETAGWTGPKSVKPEPRSLTLLSADSFKEGHELAEKIMKLSCCVKTRGVHSMLWHLEKEADFSCP